MTAEKNPNCIKCNAELSQQDSRGWEKISFPEGEGINLISKEIWICPECIHKTQVGQDLHNRIGDGKAMNILAELGFAIDKAKKNYHNEKKGILAQ